MLSEKERNAGPAASGVRLSVRRLPWLPTERERPVRNAAFPKRRRSLSDTTCAKIRRTKLAEISRTATDGPSVDIDDAFVDLEALYAEAAYTEATEDNAEGSSEDSDQADGQMRMGGEMGEVRLSSSRERPSGYRRLDSDPRNVRKRRRKSDGKAG